MSDRIEGPTQEQGDQDALGQGARDDGTDPKMKLCGVGKKEYRATSGNFARQNGDALSGTCLKLGPWGDAKREIMKRARQLDERVNGDGMRLQYRLLDDPRPVSRVALRIVGEPDCTRSWTRGKARALTDELNAC